MPRTADPNSVRQRGFRILDDMRFEKREVALKRLMSELDIDEPYAATIHASHRRLDKERGILHTFYSVEEFKDGKRVKPYIKKTTGYKPTPTQRLTIDGAVGAYIQELENKLDYVEKNLTIG